MATFPVLSCGTSVLYPLETIYQVPTEVLTFGDGGQHRFRDRPASVRFRLTLEGISAADVERVRTFFEACKGSFDQTWSLVIGSATYQHLRFDTDEFQAVESTRNRWTITLDIQQTRP